MARTKLIILLFLGYAFISVIGLTGPSELDNRDQAMQGLYILDVFQGGSFFLPSECGRPATKPPLYTWAGVAVSLVWGEVNDLTIRVPALLSGLGVVFVTFLIGELLFSKGVGLFAGLILTLSFHFAGLTLIARTDMMLCFFVSLSLYLFLLSYQQKSKKSNHNILMFVAMGVGSLTKGPVGFLLPLLVILVFLFFMKDLKWVKSMQLGLGIPVCLLIILGWFIPALIIGGREYFKIVVLDEMVNYFLGTGWHQAQKIKPYFYLGHFFEKFLPWSLFVPSGIARYWKFKNETKRDGLLFSIVWFLAIFLFFSISKGRRSDYILPLYPAASLIVGHFWCSLISRDEPGYWKSHLRVISLWYLMASFLMMTSLIAFLLIPDLAQPMARLFPEYSETIELLYRSISRHINLFLLNAFLLMAVLIWGVIVVFKGKLKNLFLVMLIVAGLNFSLYSAILSPEASRLSGEQKKMFCSRVARQIRLIKNLQFCNVESSILFYLGKNVQPLNHDKAFEFFIRTDNPYLITTEEDYLALRKQTDFECMVLEESDYLIREKTKYVLIGKGRPVFNLRQKGNPHHLRTLD